MKAFVIHLLAILFITSGGCIQEGGKSNCPVIISEFIFKTEDVPFPSCHASTIAETPEGMVTAWFGGTHEKHPDVGIWISREIHGEWTIPVEVVNGVQNDSLRYPSWNPVLYFKDSELILFYKIGPNCADWWGEMMSSNDFGKTWSEPVRLPENHWGPIRNKPVILASGELLCPSSTENNGWQVHMEFTNDNGKTWRRTESLNDGDSLSAIQPAILVHSDSILQILCRTKSNKIFSSWSYDQGNSWSSLEPIALPNNNSGIDAVTLKDGRHLLVYNHIDRSRSQAKRNILNVAISTDGLNWNAVCQIENDDDTGHEYSYPAVIQAENGKVHILYTWRRELIKHLVLDPDHIETIAIADGVWPAESGLCCSEN